MESKVIPFPKKKKSYINKYNIKMLFLLIFTAIITALLIWHYFVENPRNLDINIPASNNITYDYTKSRAITTKDVSQILQNYKGSPTLLYIYTTWCNTCKKNMPIFNEIAREFQNTNLKVVAIAIDKDLNQESMAQYLSQYSNIYFEPLYLIDKSGFLELLGQYGIKYNRVIPFTILLSKDSKVVAKYFGAKRKGYIRNKIIRELY